MYRLAQTARGSIRKPATEEGHELLSARADDQITQQTLLTATHAKVPGEHMTFTPNEIERVRGWGWWRWEGGVVVERLKQHLPSLCQTLRMLSSLSGLNT